MKHIIVLGKNYLTPLGVIRSLGNEGYCIEMIFISKRKEEAEVLRASKFLSRLLIVDEENDEKVIELIKHEYKDKQGEYVLFPTDDYSASLIDRFNNELKEMFLMPYVIDGSVSMIMDKSVQTELARKIGFNVAKSWTISLREKHIQIPEDIVFPCFVKPLVSAKGGKVGIAKCLNPEQLRRSLLIQQKRDNDRCFLVQEYLNIEQEYTIGGVCNNQDVYIPAVIKKNMIAKYNYGITLIGELVSNKELSPCFDKIRQFLREVHFKGMFDFEILKTDKGYYFGELNLRCGGPSYAYFLSGVNLPQIAVRVLEGKGLEEPINDIILGKKFLNNKVLWEDYSNLYISNKEFNRIIKSKPLTLLSDNSDSEPEIVFNRIMRPKYRMRMYRNVAKSIIKFCLPEWLLYRYTLEHIQVKRKK